MKLPGWVEIKCLSCDKSLVSFKFNGSVGISIAEILNNHAKECKPLA